MNDFPKIRERNKLVEFLLRWNRGASSRDLDWDAFLGVLSSHPEDAAKISSLCYPLHFVVLEERPPPPLRVVRAVHDAYPPAVMVGCDGNNTPLHFAVSNTRLGSDVVRFLVQANPEATAVSNDEGLLPLHCAKSAEIAELLINVYPEGLGKPDILGMIPVHRQVCDLGAPPEPPAVAALVDHGWRHNVGGPRGGGGVFVLDKRWRSALTFVNERWRANNNPSLGSIRAIIYQSACSARAGQDARDSDCPQLCSILGSGVENLSMVSRLLSRRPDEGIKTDFRGWTPLHIAAANRCSLGIINVILQSRYGLTTAAMQDLRGRLPLHLAADCGMPFFDGLWSIAMAEPRALGTTDRATRMYAFLMAASCGSNACLNSVYRLLREVPDKLKHLTDDNAAALQEDTRKRKRD